MIAIVDYGAGNVGSILNILRKIGVKAHLSRKPDELKAASKVILPGVGNFGHGMRLLAAADLLPVLEDIAVKERKPVLGICLGMQMMTRGSEESEASGLGWVAGDTIRFPRVANLKVPHMGWNRVSPKNGSQLFAQQPPEPERFYFVHSYFVKLDQPSQIACTCDYSAPFTASFEAGNLFGVQFHPEKSHQYGMALFRRFASL